MILGEMIFKFEFFRKVHNAREKPVTLFGNVRQKSSNLKFFSSKLPSFDVISLLHFILSFVLVHVEKETHICEAFQRFEQSCTLIFLLFVFVSE